MSVKDLLNGHLPASILCSITIRDLIGCDPERMILGNPLKRRCHRIASIGRITGIQHYIGNPQNVRCHRTGNSRKIMKDCIRALLPKYPQDILDISAGLIQEQKRHHSRHILFLPVIFLFFRLIMFVVISHPRLHRYEFCSGWFYYFPKGFRRKVSHAMTCIYQLCCERQCGINVPESTQRYDCNMHDFFLLFSYHGIWPYICYSAKAA